MQQLIYYLGVSSGNWLPAYHSCSTSSGWEASWSKTFTNRRHWGSSCSGLKPAENKHVYIKHNTNLILKCNWLPFVQRHTFSNSNKKKIVTSLNNHTVDGDTRTQTLTHADPAGGQLQQRCVKATAGAGEHPLGPERQLSALQTDLKEVL